LVSATAPSTKAADNAIELAALERMLRRANGFRVAFAVANHPHLRRRLAQRVRRDLPDRRIVEVTLDQEPGGIVAAIDAAAANDAGAVFVHGLELLDPLGRRARATAALNLNRDYLWRTIRVPVVFWAPDFAVRAFARAAPDLWSGRSGLYRFGPEAGDAAVTAQDTVDGFGWSLSPGARREREALLRDLHEELGEVGAEPAARAVVLSGLGDTARMQGRHADASALYDQALAIYREIGSRHGEANTLQSLGAALAGAGSSSATGTLHDAARIYELLGRDVLAEDIRRYAHGLQPVEE
jgi:tetratricopeptide (TPR) repeat protein